MTRHDARVTESPNVDVSDLRRAVGRLQDVVEGQHGPTIELGTDHYWMLRDEAAFDMATEPIAEGIVAGANSPTTWTPYTSCSKGHRMKSLSGMTSAT